MKCSATDKAGNTGSATFTVTVVDTTPPVITVPADITAEATGANGAAVTFDAATAIDLVDGPVTPTCDKQSGDTFALGTTTVTCSAKDAHGNISSARFKVIVKDTKPPDLTGSGPAPVEATGPDGAPVSFDTPTAIDIVDGSVPVSCDKQSGDIFPLGPTLVMCTATDKAGNIGSKSLTITVVDTTPPSITVPTPKAVEATGANGAVVTFVAPTASDIVDGAITPTCNKQSGETFKLGYTLVMCTATDQAGNIGSASFTVTVQDKTPPTVIVPANITAEATGPSGAPVTFTASASDLVDGAITPTCNKQSGDTFALGMTTVTCSATDQAGNAGTASFKVTVQDTTPPTLTVPADITAEATSAAGAAVTFTATAADLVDPSPVVNCTPASGATFALGMTTVSCTAKDSTGNTSNAKTFTVTVQDKTAPALTVPANITAEATSAVGATVNFQVSATDLVDGAISKFRRQAPVVPSSTSPRQQATS